MGRPPPPYPQVLGRLPLGLSVCICEMGITVSTLPGRTRPPNETQCRSLSIPSWATIHEGRVETSPSLCQGLRHRLPGELVVTSSHLSRSCTHFLADFPTLCSFLPPILPEAGSKSWHRAALTTSGHKFSPLPSLGLNFHLYMLTQRFL